MTTRQLSRNIIIQATTPKPLTQKNIPQKRPRRRAITFPKTSVSKPQTQRLPAPAGRKKGNKPSPPRPSKRPDSGSPPIKNTVPSATIKRTETHPSFLKKGIRTSIPSPRNQLKPSPKILVQGPRTEPPARPNQRPSSPKPILKRPRQSRPIPGPDPQKQAQRNRFQSRNHPKITTNSAAPPARTSPSSSPDDPFKPPMPATINRLTPPPGLLHKWPLRTALNQQKRPGQLPKTYCQAQEISGSRPREQP